MPTICVKHNAHCFNDDAADDYELNEFGGTDSVLDLRTPRCAPQPHAPCAQIPRPAGALPRG